MAWKAEGFYVILPDPYNPDGQWQQAADFDSMADASAFVQETLGGNAKGWIGLISRVPNAEPDEFDEGWLVDLPNPQQPEGPWIFVESFETKREAVAFVREKYGANAKGELKVIDVMYGDDEEKKEERGPRDWSPRWAKEKKGRKK